MGEQPPESPLTEDVGECLQMASHMAFVADLTTTRQKKEAHNMKNPSKHSTEYGRYIIRSLSKHQRRNICTLSQKLAYSPNKRYATGRGLLSTYSAQRSRIGRREPWTQVDKGHTHTSWKNIVGGCAHGLRSTELQISSLWGPKDIHAPQDLLAN